MTNAALAVPLGARQSAHGDCSFLVWAPVARRVDLQLEERVSSVAAMEQLDDGYFHLARPGVPAGTNYFYRLDGEKLRPDPASRFQPSGVHGPSQVLNAESFAWSDAGWKGTPLDDVVLYELHVGAFTPEGTLDAIIPRIGELKHLGITMLELMPVAQFPGERNWGYDGAFPFAVQNSYGGPEALKRLVNACHAEGLGVALDVVYNHFGPEGNYLADFGPYFTNRYHTPWGAALNFDGPCSDHVRRFFFENAACWIREFHIDLLRLDAVHEIVDVSAVPFIEELAGQVHSLAAELGRHIHVVAESDRNDARLVRSSDDGGLDLDAVWNDDFHHAVHALATRERSGYYADFDGGIADVAKAYSQGFVYSGQYSKFRRRRQGNSSGDLPGDRFVVFAQNHDQIGNRAAGERLSQLLDFDWLKLIAGLVTLAPGIPLLFMGEEYAETSPFLYFMSHGDPDLIRNVREGRLKEFSQAGSSQELSDPQSEETFRRSKLDWRRRQATPCSEIFAFHRSLLHLRKTVPALGNLSRWGTEVGTFEPCGLWMKRRVADDQVLVLFNCGRSAAFPICSLDPGIWRICLDSSLPAGSEFAGGDGGEIRGGRKTLLEIPAMSLAVYRLAASAP
ncbi:MAG: malto-oligosyltrehalose trehalohydrolase [Candidatus Acidiferrales bacterium]